MCESVSVFLYVDHFERQDHRRQRQTFKYSHHTSFPIAFVVIEKLIFEGQ